MPAERPSCASAVLSGGARPARSRSRGHAGLPRAVGAGALSLAIAGCQFDLPAPPAPAADSTTITGKLVDFSTGQPIARAASVTTVGLLPEPAITSQDGGFTIAGVPYNSTFQILASTTEHRPTFNTVTVGGERSLGVEAEVVSDSFLAGLATGFGVTPSAARGILLVQAVDSSGAAPRAGIAASNFVLSSAGAIGPRFLGSSWQPLPTATATSTSGALVYFEVAPGVVSFSASASATVTLDMPISPIGAATVTLAKVRATDGAIALPKNVSFATQVVPIFRPAAEGGRGCSACHSGGGVGRDLGGLALDGSPSLVYKELTQEDPLRVQLAAPEQSQLLTYPSREDPPDRHPNVTFTGPLDPDYLKILVWIREGAKNN